MNQRAGKTHAAAATDTRQSVDLMSLIKFVQQAGFAPTRFGYPIPAITGYV